MTFQHFNRRLHLYLGLGLMPWLFMYGLSSVPFAHNQYFNDRDAATGRPLWTLRTERTVDVVIPDDSRELQALGERLMAEVGVQAPNVGVYRPNAMEVVITAYSFLRVIRGTYSIPKKALKVEDRRFRVDQFLTGLHARGGFLQDGIGPTTWSLVVDLVCVAILVWILSGTYMWWSLRGHRVWGALALLASCAAFVMFTMSL